MKEKFVGPVATVNFPYMTKDSRAVLNADFKEKESNKLSILTLGHVNSNKKIDVCIHVLGKNKALLKRVDYKIIGSYEHSDYYSHLQSLVEKYDIGDCVKFLGFQPDEELFSNLKACDICINLRRPIIEGASVSVIEQMSYGKPVIVADAGFYSELPNDSVVKIAPLCEEAGLKQAIEMLCDDSSLRGSIGEAASDFVLNNCTDRLACEKLMKFCEVVCSKKPMLELMNVVGEKMKLMKVKDRYFVDSVAGEIKKLIG